MIKEVFVALTVSAFAHTAVAQVVAKVGHTQITLKEFKEKYADVRRQTVNPPSPEVFLNDLIRFEIGVQEAEKRHLESDPIVKERFKQELYKALIEKEVGSQVDNIKVSEAEMREYYKKNPEIRSSHILIEYKAGSTPAQIQIARKRANEIYAEVKKSKRPFEELVKLYSDDTFSKNAGGDIGYQNAISMVLPYYEALLKLKPNAISAPVQTQYGFHIIKNTGIRSFKDANRSQIRMAIYNEKRKVLFDKYFKTLSSRYPVTKDEKLIKSLK